MKITLKINEEDRQFTAPFVSTRKLKDTLKLSNKVNTGFTEDILDELIDYEVSLYGNQFTIDDLLDGFAAGDFFNKILEDMQTVLGNFDSATKN